MKISYKILLVNLIIALSGALVLYLIIQYDIGGNDDYMIPLLTSLIAFWLIFGLGLLINLILGIVHLVKGKKESGKAFLLSAGLMLLIGNSSCGFAMSGAKKPKKSKPTYISDSTITQNSKDTASVSIDAAFSGNK